MTDTERTGDPGAERRAWRDFAHTLNRLVELSAIRRDLAAEDAADPRLAGAGSPSAAQRFSFVPMAAAPAGPPPLPSAEAEALDTTQSLGLWVEPMEDSTLCVHLQAKGYSAIDSLAERWATVSSADRLVHASVRFDRDGHAECRVPDRPDIREALARTVDVVFPELRFGFAPPDGHDAAP